MSSTQTAEQSVLSEAQAKLMQRAAWGLLHVQYESWGVGVVRSYSREVNHLLTGIKGERRGAARKDSVEKLIRDGMLTRGAGHQVRPTPEGRAALDAFNGVPAPVAPVEEKPVETTVEETPAAPVVEEAADDVIRSHAGKSSAAMAELRALVESAKSEHSWASEADDKAEESATGEEATEHAETAEQCAKDAAKTLADAKKVRTRVRAARKAVDALISGDSSELAEEIRATVCADEADAEELYGEAEQAAEGARECADAAWEKADDTCMTCGFFTCACRETMSAVLNRFGAPVVDAQAVALGYMHLSDDPDVVAEGQRAIATGYDVPLFSLDVVEDVEEEPEFPGALEDGESAEHVGDGVWNVTYREGFTYELHPSRCSVRPGRYEVSRITSDGSLRRWSAIFDDQSIGPVVKWTRAESRTLAETRAFQEKYGHLHGDGSAARPRVEAPFSLELVTEELEPGRVWRVSRFGRSGVLVLQGWGYGLLSETGDFPETPNRRYIGGKRWRYAIQCVVGGMDDVPTERMRLVAVDRSGEPCAVNGHDAGQSCESGKRRRSAPRFTVEVLHEDGRSAGRVPMCAHCWRWRAAGVESYYAWKAPNAAYSLSEGKGTWVDWQDRAEDLTGELISAALDAGEPVPDVTAALYAEALAVGDERAAKAARAAAVKGGARKVEADAVRERVLAERAAAHSELIAWAELREAQWSAHISATVDARDKGLPEPEWVPPVKPGPSVEVAADVVTYSGEDDDQEQGEQESMGRRGMAPKAKGKASKVGDIVFTGDQKRGRERAELLGHAYEVIQLASRYTVRHLGTGETVCADEPKRPPVKQAILADAVARGEQQPVAEEQPEPDSHLPKALRLALERDAEEPCKDCLQDPCDCYDPRDEDEDEEPEPVESVVAERFPELARFMEPRGEDAPMLVLNLFSGPGGAVIALRDVLRQELGRDVEIINIDNDADCVATLRAAGFLAIQADISTLDPSDPVFSQVRGVIITPPCTDYTDSGKRLGRLPENVDVLVDVWDTARRAAGMIPLGGMGDHPDFGKDIEHAEPSGFTWAEVRADLEEYSGPTGHLMLEVAVWGMGLQAAGAPLEWVAVEQSSKLPEQIRGEVAADFQLAGWAMAEWHIADAADYGSPVQRVRALMVARRDSLTDVTVDAPGWATGSAQATDREHGTQVFTRGVGKRTGGGNVVVLREDGPYTAFTSRIRSVDVAEKGGRFTLSEIARLAAISPEYPVQGSRTSACQQIADVWIPTVAAAFLGMALGMAWMPHLGTYLAGLFPEVHGELADTEEIPDQTPVGDGAEVEEQESALADTEEIESAEECTHGGYAWLTIDTATEDGRGVSVGCACNGVRLTRKGKSRTSAANLAECESCVIVGEWERVSDTVERVAVEWRPRRDIPTMRETLEHHYPEGWTPYCTADMSWLDVDQEDDEPGPVEGAWGLGQVPSEVREIAERMAGITEQDRQQQAERLAAWGLTYPQPAPVEEKPKQPNTGRGYWENGSRVTLERRAGHVLTSRTGKGVLVLWDDAEPGVGTWHAPQVLWVEGTEPQPERADERDELLAQLLTEELREPVAVDPRIAWMMPKPEPVDPRTAWMDYERPEAAPEVSTSVDPLAELRAELEELRGDVESWGAEVAALAVAEAERIVREVARDMRAAEILELREEARELRESLGWGPMEVVPVEAPRRVRPWRAAWTVAASVAALAAAGWSEGVERAMRG
ncbi:hypothetical protein ACIA8H_12865 [Streptomyces goshikiensis]|uniref:hypothetical protein n=1 Tax=Streptomyces goshikiensis TaxID=1942 RepID=UPI003787621E